mgnify:CR=1 FL=1|tara:strand:- start:739 stop:1251 length:513 start_codon:yes stop_codon:yes gene_type:complete
MASIQAFIAIVEEFLNDLNKSFPDDEKISEYKKWVEEKKESEPQLILDDFTSSTKGELGKMIVERQNKFFKRSPFARKLNISALWNDMSRKTKDAIWQYLNTMYVLSTTISNIPQSLLSTIESMAEQCASQMGENGDSPQNMPDMSTLLAGMQNMMGVMAPDVQSQKKKK